MKLYGILGYTKSPSLTFKKISTSHKNFSLNFVIETNMSLAYYKLMKRKLNKMFEKHFSKWIKKIR